MARVAYLIDEQIGSIAHLTKLAEDAKSAAFTDFCLLGMGGSSLCPEVFAHDLRKNRRLPGTARSRFHRSCASQSHREKDRSGQYPLHRFQQIRHDARTQHLQTIFFRARKEVSAQTKPASRFIAVTDPGSKMQQVAEARQFPQIFLGVPSIGGRYSALSNFGMVPAAVMGIDVTHFLIAQLKW